MEWYVYRHNINNDTIEIYNVFNHGGFWQDLKKNWDKNQNDFDFKHRLKQDAMYWFWGKAEHEVIIKPWVGGKELTHRKVDVYDQLRLNWPRFADYTWKEMQKGGW